MRTVSTEGAIDFDPFDCAVQEDPYPVYARCRAEDPLHHNETHDSAVHGLIAAFLDEG